MRTTVTLEPGVEALIKSAMAERGLTFKEALNQAIRAAARLTPPPVAPPSGDWTCPG